MRDVTGKTFEGQEMVETDGTTFTNCDFRSAVLVYRGGERFIAHLFEKGRYFEE